MRSTTPSAACRAWLSYSLLRYAASSRWTVHKYQYVNINMCCRSHNVSDKLPCPHIPVHCWMQHSKPGAKADQDSQRNTTTISGLALWLAASACARVDCVEQDIFDKRNCSARRSRAAIEYMAFPGGWCSAGWSMENWRRFCNLWLYIENN